jgi:stage V sporulation protein B
VPEGGRGRDAFLKGAFILAVSSGFSRVLGAFARIPLARLIGAEGIGLYQMAYPIYSVLLALSTTGINIAVSKLVAEKVAAGRWRAAMSVFRSALVMLLLLGLVGTIGLAFSARAVADHVAHDPRAYLAVLAISPALLLVSSMAALRGLFQGLQDMGPTAVSQVVEQVVRVTTMFWLGLALLPLGIERAAAGAVFGAVTGALVGLAYLAWRYARVRGELWRRALATSADPGSGAGEAIGQILRVAVPISLASIIMPLMQFIDMAVVPGRLQTLGYSYQTATGLYGQLSGMAYPLIYVPTIFTAALAVSLVPAVSEAQVSRPDWVRSRTALALRLNFLVNIPAAVGLAVLAREICVFLYKEPSAGIPLAWLTPGIVFLSVQMTTGAVLQGLGRSDLPVKHLAVGGAIKLILTYVLTGIPSFGVVGAAIGTVLGFAVNSYLNTRSVAVLTGRSTQAIRMSIPPSLAAGVMGVLLATTKGRLLSVATTSVATIVAVGVGLATYGILILAMGAVTAPEVEMFPWIGEPLARLLERLKLIRG